MRCAEAAATHGPPRPILGSYQSRCWGQREPGSDAQVLGLQRCQHLRARGAFFEGGRGGGRGVPSNFKDVRKDRVRNAKLAIDFKLSQWLPLHERRKTGGAVNSQSNQALS